MDYERHVFRNYKIGTGHTDEQMVDGSIISILNLKLELCYDYESKQPYSLETHTYHFGIKNHNV